MYVLCSILRLRTTSRGQLNTRTIVCNSRHLLWGQSHLLYHFPLGGQYPPGQQRGEREREDEGEIEGGWEGGRERGRE